MTYQKRYGSCYLVFYLGSEANGEVLQQIIANLSMQCFGYCAQERRGGIYRLITEVGRTRTADFAAGETKEYGKGYWKRWQEALITNG